MFKKRGSKAIILVILAALISFYFDSQIVKAVSLIRLDLLNEFFLAITSTSFNIIVFFFITSLFLWNYKKSHQILPIWVTLGLSAFVGFLIKISVQRVRPFQTAIVSTLPELAKNSHLAWNTSFPSFQAMMAFCALPILVKEFPRLKYWLFLLAGLVAFSRVYFGLHFLSDVLIGGLIGYLLGVWVIRSEEKTKFLGKLQKKFKKLLDKI